MPTKKKRIGFIPRSDVLEIITKLSLECNLSHSKIINILVEEALFKRGIFNIKLSDINSEINNNINNEENISYFKKGSNITKNSKNILFNEFKEILFESDNSRNKECQVDYIDSDIYMKFLMFLEFSEKMSKNNL